VAALPRFTPSLLDHATLEQLFVNREPLLEEVIARIVRAAQSSERAHKLWVGPRGAGKTHLVSLVYHRARALVGFGTAFQIAWMPEDPWTVDSLDDLLGEVLDHLEPPTEVRTDRPEDDIVRAARARGPIVVLIENLDQVFDVIGPDGQRLLRALLENDRPLLLVATATKLTEYLISKAEPFYGFFDTTTLQPFSVDEAATMLKGIAKYTGDAALVHRLDEGAARARLAAVKYLAGGQPRIWALLGAGLSIEALDDLVSALLERFDDLTPYYQEQLGRLSGNERKAVLTLAGGDRAMTVRDLAAAIGVTQQSLAKTMTDLRRNGWVRARTGLLAGKVDQRLHYYELAEPLVRLAFQLKSSRGKPLKLIVDFLTAWFDPEHLVSAIATDQAVEAYLQAAKEAIFREPGAQLVKSLSGHGIATPEYEVPVTVQQFGNVALRDDSPLMAVIARLDDALAAYQQGDASPLLDQPAALSHLIEHRLKSTTTTGLRVELSDIALTLLVDDPIEWCSRAESIAGSAGDTDAVAAFFVLARWHLRAGNQSAANFAVHQAVVAIQDAPSPVATMSAIASAGSMIRSGHESIAAGMLKAVGPLAPVDQQLVLGTALEAVAMRSGQPDEAVAQWQAILVRVVDSIGPDNSGVLPIRGKLASTLLSARRATEALGILGPLVAEMERVLGASHPNTLSVRGNLGAALGLLGQFSEAREIFQTLVAESEQVLGLDHPVTVSARSNLAISLQATGTLEQARLVFEELVAYSETIHPPDHPDSLRARANLAGFSMSTGDAPRAIAMLELLVVDMERVYGPDHPGTVRAVASLRALEERATIEEG